MKKISFMLVAFFCTLFAAQAQTFVTDLSQLDNGNTYALRSERAFLLYSTAVSDKLCSSNGTNVGTVEYNPEDPSQQFRIEKSGDNYYLYSVGAEKYVSANGSYVDKGSAAVLTLKKVDRDYPWMLDLGGNELNSQIKGQMPTGITVSDWNNADAGNCYQITEAIAKAKLYTIDMLGVEDAMVIYDGEAYTEGDTIEAKNLKKSELTALEVEGKFSVINVDGTTVYVSYMDVTTKFYTMRGGHGGYVSLGEGYTDGG